MAGCVYRMCMNILYRPFPSYAFSLETFSGNMLKTIATGLSWSDRDVTAGVGRRSLVASTAPCGHSQSKILELERPLQRRRAGNVHTCTRFSMASQARREPIGGAVLDILHCGADPALHWRALLGDGDPVGCVRDMESCVQCGERAELNHEA